MIRALLVMLLLLASTAQAETIDPRNAKYDVCGAFELYHINGVNTDINGARENLTRIKEVYGNAHKGHLIRYTLAYNQHRRFLIDFMDSAKQVISLYAMATWDKWMNAVTFGIYSIGMDAATSAAIAKKVTDVWGFTKPNPYQDQEMNEIMAVIQANSTYASRLILAPHSQGNFYSSLVYDKLILMGIKPAKSIGVVGLAVPYSSVRGGNSYLTSANDLIVDTVRLATLNNVLSPTHSIPYQPFVDPFGHNMRAIYLAHSPTRDAYVTLIQLKFNGLKTNGAGPFWAPESYGVPIKYNTVTYFPPSVHWSGTTIPSYYWYYLPDLSGGWSGYVNGSLTQATAAAKANGQACYNLHIKETLKARAAGNFGWVTLPTAGCWGSMSTPIMGSWWPYSGDYPAFRTHYDATYAQITTSAGAMCTI